MNQTGQALDKRYAASRVTHLVNDQAVGFLFEEDHFGFELLKRERRARGTIVRDTDESDPHAIGLKSPGIEEVGGNAAQPLLETRGQTEARHTGSQSYACLL